MVKKYMNQLYKEIMWYKKKIDHGNLKYFAQKDIGDANCFIVILKDGSYFYINIGANNIPKINKRDIAFIHKTLNRYDRKMHRQYQDSFDSDNGYRCYDDSDRYGMSRYLSEKYKKYNIDYDKEIDTGCWD